MTGEAEESGAGADSLMKCCADRGMWQEKACCVAGLLPTARNRQMLLARQHKSQDVYCILSS